MIAVTAAGPIPRPINPRSSCAGADRHITGGRDLGGSYGLVLEKPRRNRLASHLISLPVQSCRIGREIRNPLCLFDVAGRWLGQQRVRPLRPCVPGLDDGVCQLAVGIVSELFASIGTEILDFLQLAGYLVLQFRCPLGVARLGGLAALCNEQAHGKQLSVP